MERLYHALPAILVGAWIAAGAYLIWGPA